LFVFIAVISRKWAHPHMLQCIWLC